MSMIDVAEQRASATRPDDCPRPAAGDLPRLGRLLSPLLSTAGHCNQRGGLAFGGEGPGGVLSAVVRVHDRPVQAAPGPL
ncbi:hypothetical protein ACIBTV_30910, partial [Micromonospora sp. NPDC049366]|uniref:hypothetical protein n=1 Tax=Micromonospora sp. NPDC049366 TaxID=3364271 RepID=UPI0037A8163E